MRSITLVSLLVLLIIAVLPPSPTSAAEVPQLISYQGRLNDTNGDPVTDGTYLLKFAIYDRELGGNPLWQSSGFVPVQVTDGLFSHLLGLTWPVPDTLVLYDSLWLGVTVSPDAELTPRTRLVSTVFTYKALFAANAQSAGFAYTIADNAVDSSKIENGSISVEDLGQNGALLGEVLKWAGSQWEPDSISGDYRMSWFSMPSTAGDFPVHGLGFKPDFIIVLCATETWEEGPPMAIGFLTESATHSIQMGSYNSNFGGGSNIAEVQGKTGAAGTLSYRFNLASMDPLGFTLHFTQTDPTMRVIYLAVRL